MINRYSLILSQFLNSHEMYFQGHVTILKARLMKPDTLNMLYINSAKPGLDESFEIIKKAIPQTAFLFENDFLEIDVPVDEMTMR